MAIQETETVTITETKEVKKTATVKAGTKLSVDFSKKELQLTVEYGNLDADNNFIGLGEDVVYTISNEPDWVGEYRESHTVDASQQITLNYDYESNLEVTKEGVTINNTVEDRTVTLADLADGDVVNVIYTGYEPPRPYFNEIINSACTTDSLADNVKSLIWGKLKELEKVDGDIIDSGSTL